MLTNLPLETYIDVHAALTKGTAQVQKVSAVEKAMYKMSDLKQVVYNEELEDACNFTAIEW